MVGTEKCGAPGKTLAYNSTWHAASTITIRARLTFALIDAKRVLEIANRAVNALMIPQGGTARRNGTVKNINDGRAQFPAFRIA